MDTCTLKCQCGATCQGIVVEDDPSTNSFIAEPRRHDEWEGGRPECPHDDYEATDIESDDGGDV